MNVGVDIGSRGVGDASGVGDGLAVAVGDGEGDAGGRGGSCATARNGRRNRSEITVNTHEDIVMDSFLLVVIEMELVETELILTQMLAQECNRASPGIGRRFGVVNLRTLIIEKGMIRAGINLRFDLLAERFHFTL